MPRPLVFLALLAVGACTRSSTGDVTPAPVAAAAADAPASAPAPAATPIRVSMKPFLFPPVSALQGDSTLEVRVRITDDGRPDLSTLQVSGRRDSTQRAEIAAWLTSGTYDLPVRDGRTVGGDFVFKATRAGSGFEATTVTSRPAPPRQRPRGSLSLPRLREMGRQVARLASDIDTVRVRPGQRLMFDRTLRIAALDGDGRFLGFVTDYDSEATGGTLRIDGYSLTGGEEGAGTLVLRIPRAAWADSTRPAPSVRLVVITSEDVSDVQLARQAVATGGGSVNCELAAPRGPATVQCGSWAERVRMDEASPAAASLANPPREVIRLRYLVIERGAQLTWNPMEGDSSARAARMQARRDAQRRHERAVEDRGHIFQGFLDADGIPRGFEFSLARPDTVWVGERPFGVPWRRDSAMVLLVDHRAGPQPTVTRLVIPSDAPENVEARMWTRGDTTFSVRPRDTYLRWRAHLERFPGIAAFLR